MTDLEFDDGHIEGAMLLEYEVDQGRVYWKRLWSRLNQARAATHVPGLICHPCARSGPLFA